MPEPIDAADISGDDILWRRIDSHMITKSFDGTESIQSWAYKDQNDELSVYLARETTSAAVLAIGKPEQVLIGIKVSSVRALGYKVVRDPDPNNSAHCLIVPYPNKKDFKKLTNASARINEKA
jgi:diadenosine tetraphosphate (Ap4A) HIT family hydrolase